MQKKGIDYSETFAPVALSASNRLIYVIAARWKRKVRKGDVVSAFQRTANTQHIIYAELCEGIELVQPEYDKKDDVMKLNNAINSTMQSGREFNDKLYSVKNETWNSKNKRGCLSLQYWIRRGKYAATGRFSFGRLSICCYER